MPSSSSDVEIRYMRWGWAYRKNNTVYMNEAILNNPLVFEDVLNHELEHQPGPYNHHDLTHDIGLAHPRKLLFILTHPRTWTLISPIWREDGHWAYDPSMIILDTLLAFLGIILLAKYL